MTRPFHRQQHRATPFATDADALNYSQNRQDNRAPYADRFISWHKCDEESCDAHAQECCDEGRFAPDPVAVVAEYRRTDRPTDEPDEIGAEGQQRRRQWI